MQPNETVYKANLIDAPDRTDEEFFRSQREELLENRGSQLWSLALRAIARTLMGILLTAYPKEPIYYISASNSTQGEFFEPLESSTKEIEYGEQVEQQVDNVFEEALEQDFEDGKESRFSRGLLSLVRQYHTSAMSEIAYLITYGKVNSEVASEALRWLGRVADPSTYQYRRWLLERSLDSPWAQVRDGAGLGLVSMGDPGAIPYLKQAIGRENNIELRGDLEQALEELEDASHGTVPESDKKE